MKKDLMKANIGMVEYIGYVKITLLHAVNLLSMGFKKNDDQQTNPFVIMQIGSQKVKSKTIHGTIDPHWNQEMMICWDGIESLTLDVFSSDEHMGCATLPLDFLLEEEGDEGGKESICSNLPDLSSIGEEEEEEEDDAGGAGGGGGGGGEGDGVLLGNQTKSGEKDPSLGKTSLFLPLEQRDVHKVGKKVKGIKSTARKIGRGSVFNPREASGGVFISIEFERLAH